jgi:hypothetical protein
MSNVKSTKVNLFARLLSSHVATHALADVHVAILELRAFTARTRELKVFLVPGILLGAASCLSGVGHCLDLLAKRTG